MFAFHPLQTLAQAVHSAAMRLIALMIGIAALLMGLLWVGQGAGMVHWPASSFMLDQRPLIIRGAILAAAGLVLIAISQVRR